MGVDIEEGSPSSRTRRAKYSIVIIDEDARIIDKYEKAGLARLIRLAWYYKPKILALDNIMELAASRKSLQRVLELFPAETDIVQVTLGPNGFKSIKELAGPYRDLVGQGKLSPNKTAYLLALLAKEGYGVKVRTVEQRTLILVTKSRSPRGGGFSQQRYQRRVRASVLNAAMRVKSALDEAGLDYDLRYRRSEGGLESAVFIVYAPRDRLVGVVRPHKGLDYQIIVKPQYKVTLNIPGEPGRHGPSLIVGIDPGITTGVAVLDLRGRVLLLESAKNMDRAKILDLILSQGKPLIIAVDVPEVPETVRKIASITGAMIYTPQSELSVSEKRILAEKALHGRLPEDSHQRDALAAAFKAWRSLQGKLEHIDTQLRRIGININESLVKEAVIRGVTLAEALEEAIRRELETIEESDERPKHTRLKPRERPESTRETSSPPARVEALEVEVSLLREKLRGLTRENEELRERLEREISRFKASVYRDSLVSKLENRIDALTGQLERLEDEKKKLEDKIRELEDYILSVWSDRLIVAAKLKSLTVNNIKKAVETMPEGLTGELVYVENPAYDERALEILADMKILGIIVQGSPDIGLLRKAASRKIIPVLTESETGARPVYVAGDYVLLPYGLRELVSESKRKLEESIAASIRLERLVSEYRRSRLQGG